MNRDELVSWLQAGPDGTLVPARVVLEALEDDGERSGLLDWTVAQAADEADVAESTIRTWAPEIEGAYKLGREWRIPPDALRDYMRHRGSKDTARAAPGPRRRPADLSAWRKEAS